MANKRNKALLTSCLDISCSSDPIRDLNLLAACKAFYDIDISWCHFDEASLERFMKQLLSSKKPPFIIITSGDEPWLAHLKEKYEKAFYIVERADHHRNEIAVFKPSDARQLKLYQHLPLKK